MWTFHSDSMACMTRGYQIPASRPDKTGVAINVFLAFKGSDYVRSRTTYSYSSVPVVACTLWV